MSFGRVAGNYTALRPHHHIAEPAATINTTMRTWFDIDSAKRLTRSQFSPSSQVS